MMKMAISKTLPQAQPCGLQHYPDITPTLPQFNDEIIGVVLKYSNAESLMNSGLQHYPTLPQHYPNFSVGCRGHYPRLNHAGYRCINVDITPDITPTLPPVNHAGYNITPASRVCTHVGYIHPLKGVYTRHYMRCVGRDFCDEVMI